MRFVTDRAFFKLYSLAVQFILNSLTRYELLNFALGWRRWFKIPIAGRLLRILTILRILFWLVITTVLLVMTITRGRFVVIVISSPVATTVLIRVLFWGTGLFLPIVHLNIPLIISSTRRC